MPQALVVSFHFFVKLLHLGFVSIGIVPHYEAFIKLYDLGKIELLAGRLVQPAARLNNLHPSVGQLRPFDFIFSFQSLTMRVS